MISEVDHLSVYLLAIFYIFEVISMQVLCPFLKNI